jgi:endonuclease/exonuclease/phosphatase family metal-dependent hydrolase
MGLHPVHGPLLHRLDTDYGNAILCPQPPSAVRFIDLQIGRREPRGAIDADIEVDGQPLRVIATHLGLLGNERRRQMRLLRDALRATNPRVPLVILADLNEWFAGARTLRSLLDFGGRSVRSFPSSWPALALDRVLVQPAHLVGEVRAHVSPIACVASDHLPVRAELPPSSRVARGRAARAPRSKTSIRAPPWLFSIVRLVSATAAATTRPRCRAPPAAMPTGT